MMMMTTMMMNSKEEIFLAWLLNEKVKNLVKNSSRARTSSLLLALDIVFEDFSLGQIN